MRPCPSSLCRFGATTPKRSIRVRNTLYEASIALSYCLRSRAITSSSEAFAFSWSRKAPEPNTTESLLLGANCLYSLIKALIKSPSAPALLASSIALLKLGSSVPLANERSKSPALSLSTTFIPPLRSSPRPICCARASLSV